MMSHVNTIVKPLFKRKPRVKDATLLVGMPGIGLIGKIVADYLINKYKAKPLYDLYSPYFPQHMFMTKEATLKPIKATLYLFRDKKRAFLVLVGDAQPLDAYGHYDFAHHVLELCKDIGVKRVIAVGGYSTGKLGPASKVFGLLSEHTAKANKELRKQLTSLGVVFGEVEGTIIGAAGLLPGFFSEGDGICLLGETHGEYIDVSSARNVLKVLKSYLDLDVELEEMEKEAEKGDQIIKKIEQEVKKKMIKPPNDKDITYIR